LSLNLGGNAPLLPQKHAASDQIIVPTVRMIGPAR